MSQNPKDWNTEHEYDDLAQIGYVVITRRRDKTVPTIEKVCGELHFTPKSAQEALKELKEKIGDYYEVRSIMCFVGKEPC